RPRFWPRCQKTAEGKHSVVFGCLPRSMDPAYLIHAYGVKQGQAEGQFVIDKYTLMFYDSYALTYGGAYKHENDSPMGTFSRRYHTSGPDQSPVQRHV